MIRPPTTDHRPPTKYDFDLPRALTPDDLAAIEKRMRRIIAGNVPFVPHEVSAEAARELFRDQPYKLELVDGLARGLDEYGKDRMQAKIRKAQLQKTPYMLVVGDKEQEAGAVAVRLRSGDTLGAVPLDGLIERMRGEVMNRDA